MIDERSIAGNAIRARQSAESQPWVARVSLYSDIAITITCFLAAFALDWVWIGLVILAAVKAVEAFYVFKEYPENADGKKSKLAWVLITTLAALTLAAMFYFTNFDMALFGIISAAAIVFFVALDPLWDIINNRGVRRNAQTFLACVSAALFLTFSLTKGFSAGPLVAAFVTLGFVLLKTIVEREQIFKSAEVTGPEFVAQVASPEDLDRSAIVARDQKNSSTISVSTSTSVSFPKFSEWRDFLIKSDGTINKTGYLYPKLMRFLDERYPDRTRVSFRHTYFGQDVNQTKDEIMDYIVSMVKANNSDNLQTYLKDLGMSDANLRKIFPATEFHLPSSDATPSATSSRLR